MVKIHVIDARNLYLIYSLEAIVNKHFNFIIEHFEKYNINHFLFYYLSFFKIKTKLKYSTKNKRKLYAHKYIFQFPNNVNFLTYAYY